MTLHEVSSQLYSLSVAGYFNHTKFSKTQFTNAMKSWMSGQKKSIIMEISLPDGWWYFEVINYGSGYDYYIPETREQNDRLFKKLLSRNNIKCAEA